MKIKKNLRRISRWARKMRRNPNYFMDLMARYDDWCRPRPLP